MSRIYWLPLLMGATSCLAGRIEGGEVLNRRPQPTTDSVQLAEDETVLIDVLANDIDPDGDALRIVTVSAPAFGEVTHDGQRIRYTPNTDYAGSDSFLYGVEDDQGATASARVDVKVSAVNDPPVAVAPTAQQTSEGVPVVFVLSGTDAEDPSTDLEVRVTRPPAVGSLSPQFGAAPLSVTFTPPPQGGGYDELEFIVTDPDGLASVPAVVGLSVTASNDPPVLVRNLPLQLSSGQSAVIDDAYLLADDADTPPTQLGFRVDSLPLHGELRRSGGALLLGAVVSQAEISAGSLSYDHGGASTAADGFDFTLSDGETAIDGRFDISVLALAAPPTLVANSGATVDEGGAVVLSSAMLRTEDNDSPASAISYTVQIAPSHGQLLVTDQTASGFTQAQINTGEVSYLHGGAENTSDGFDFVVSDGDTVIAASFSITITPLNDPPTVAVNAGLSVVEGGAATIDEGRLGLSDPDHGPAALRFELATTPQHGVLRRDGTQLGAGDSFGQQDLAAAVVSYEHGGGEDSSDGFGFVATDGVDRLAERTFAISVIATNDAPQLLTHGTLEVDEGAAETLDTAVLAATDPDNTPAQLQYEILLQPQHGTLRRNATPLAAGAVFSQFELNNGNINYRHDGGESTADALSVELSDGAAVLPPIELDIAINPVSDPPALSTNTGLELFEGASATISNSHLQATDPDNTPAQLSYTVTAPPSAGELRLHGSGLSLNDPFTQADINAGDLVYAHNGGETTADGVGFSVGDGSSQVTGYFGITVTPVNDLPAANPVSDLAIDQDTSTPAFTLTGTDVEDAVAQLTVTVTSGPSDGTLSVFNGAAPLSVYYTPNAGFSGTDYFEFILTDTQSGASPSQGVNIDVVGGFAVPLVTAGDVGQFPAVVAQDQTVLVFFKAGAELRLLRSDDNGRTFPTERSVASATQPAAVLHNGKVWLSFHLAGGGLGFASSPDKGNTWSTTVTVDAPGGVDVGSHNDIAVKTSTGEIFIAYYDATNGDAKLATSLDGGASWTASAVEQTGNVGQHPSVWVKGNTLFLAYQDVDSGAVRAGRSIDGGASWQVLQTVAGPANLGRFSSIAAACAICANNVYITYRDDGTGELGFARSTNSGTDWVTMTPIASGDDTGDLAALTAVDAGLLYVVYANLSDNSLRFRRSTDGGDTWLAEATVDNVVAASRSALAVVGDLVYVAYYDATNGDLVFARSVDGGLSW